LAFAEGFALSGSGWLGGYFCSHFFASSGWFACRYFLCASLLNGTSFSFPEFLGCLGSPLCSLACFFRSFGICLGLSPGFFRSLGVGLRLPLQLGNVLPHFIGRNRRSLPYSEVFDWSADRLARTRTPESGHRRITSAGKKSRLANVWRGFWRKLLETSVDLAQSHPCITDVLGHPPPALGLINGADQPGAFIDQSNTLGNLFLHGLRKRSSTTAQRSYVRGRRAEHLGLLWTSKEITLRDGRLRRNWSRSGLRRPDTR
jgi:hypothetical protein